MLNVNVGLLGHVDSGKTTLAKALSTVASTASFDKHPQSQERGITIDLGFSSFKIASPAHLSHFQTVQFTLVDCPGHASLISTVIGGSQIIDMMILVVDASKGVQTQTAECMVIAEITAKKIIVVINKIDLLKKEQQEKIIRKMRLTVDAMSFKGAPIVCVSAAQGNVQAVVDCLREQAFAPARDATAPFLMAADHCFSIQGKGTVLTGTILQGSTKIGDEVEIPSIKITRKIKSIQMFREAVQSAQQGDRVGVCVTQFDPKTLERGLVCRPGLLTSSFAAIMDFAKVRFYSSLISSRTRYHIAIGHETALATVILFQSVQDKKDFDVSQNYKFVGTTEEITDWDTSRVFALLEFDRAVLSADSAWVIGARLDLDKNASSCRMAFYGKLLHCFTAKNYKLEDLPKLKIFKEKTREGVLERITDTQTVIGKNMFKKSTDLSKFVGMAVALSTGEHGLIESSFGQSGKFKVRVPGGIHESTMNISSKGKATEDDGKEDKIKIVLKGMRFLFDPQKKLIQAKD